MKNKQLPNQNSNRGLCWLCFDVKIDEEKKQIYLKGYEYARFDGGELRGVLHEEEWVKASIPFSEWIKCKQQFKSPRKANQKFLIRLNYTAYVWVNDELNRLEVFEQEDIRKKESPEGKMLEDYQPNEEGLEHELRIRDRETLREGRNELLKWFREEGLGLPDYPPKEPRPEDDTHKRKRRASKPRINPTEFINTEEKHQFAKGWLRNYIKTECENLTLKQGQTVPTHKVQAIITRAEEKGYRFSKNAESTVRATLSSLGYSKEK